MIAIGFQLLQIFHLVLPIVYIGYILNPWVLGLLLIQIIVMFAVSEFCPHFLTIWTTAILFLMSHQLPILHGMPNFFLRDVTEEERHLALVAMFWMNSRCVSFCLDHLWNEQTLSKIGKLTKMTSFCFYLPTCIVGPLVNYKEYHEGVLKPKSNSWKNK